MLSFKEDFLHFVWQHKLLKPTTLKTVNGLTLEILKPGSLNTDSGADFFNAQIKINNLILAGNVEIHINSSDWLKHNHQQDKSYDNIILHVVYNADKLIEQNTINNVEVLEIKDLIQENVQHNYLRFLNSKTTLPCSSQLHLVPKPIVSSWVNRMAIERLEGKLNDIEKLFTNFNSDYSQTFYAVLLRNFGFKVNNLPFELLATHLPLTVLLKHSTSQLQTEALLFGTAGMLNENFEDKYMQQLQNEFEFLQNKYKLVCLDKSIFKYSKLRPANFPGLRLAQFAQLIFTHPTLLSGIETITHVNDLKSVLNIKLNTYWQNHYKPDGTKTQETLTFGESSKQSLLINTFSYFYFFYGKKLNKPFYQNLALTLLEEATFETNFKTKKYKAVLSMKKGALESQGFINLHDNYCVKKQCLKCGIAASIIHQPF